MIFLTTLHGKKEILISGTYLITQIFTSETKDKRFQSDSDVKKQGLH